MKEDKTKEEKTKEEMMDDERRGFLKKVASVSIATAFGGLAATTKADAAQHMKAGAAKQGFKVTRKEKPPNANRAEGSDLEDGDLAKIAAKLNQHPDVAVRAIMKQTAMGLASKEDARADFGRDVHGALKKLNIDLPKDLLPKQLRVPQKVLEAASKRKGWGIGAGHSNWNRYTTHNNHHRYSDYTDWW